MSEQPAEAGQAADDPEEPPPVEPHPLPAPDPVTFLPAMYYSAIVRDDNQACANYATEFTIPELYSNAGNPVPQCGLTRHPMTIMSATLLDPQPEYS